MSQEIVISSNPVETTVAIREDDRLAEVHVEHHQHRTTVGSIFKGRVTRVLPGMQCAFVDVGLDRDAFLHVRDVIAKTDPEDGGEGDSQAAPVPAEKSAGKQAPGPPARSRSRRRRRRRRRSRKGAPARTIAADTRAADSAGSAAEERPPGEEAPQAESPGVLPGESLAKYGGRRRGGRRRRRFRGRRTRRPRAATAANGDRAEETSPGGESGSEPPARKATVEPPETVANLWNPFKWLGGKPKSGERAKPKPRPQPDRPKRRRRRRAKPTAGEKPRKPTRAPKPGPAGRTRRRRRRQPRRFRGKPQHRPAKAGERGRAKAAARKANISELLKAGQELIVQVNKEPVGAKGAKITSHVTLPGRYTVFMTAAERGGVARQIQPDSERGRLRKLVRQLTGDKPGAFVVRTAAAGVSKEDLEKDVSHLHSLWLRIQQDAESRSAPAELHRDLDVVERVLRDQLSEDCRAVWVDSPEQQERVTATVERFQPALADRVKLHAKAGPIGDSFGIRKDLAKALRPKVWLKSGGYLVIDQTEALVAIDVNTGRYVGQSDRLEDTVLQTNLEAAEEVIRQLRLRDLGGIIVVDFIDMEVRKNRQKVQQVMQEALRKMKSPSRLLPFNDFGMVVITRKSSRQSLERAMCAPCPSCGGAGTVKSSNTVLSEIFSAMRRRSRRRKPASGNGSNGMTLRVHPEVAKSLKRRASSHLQDLEQAAGTSLIVKGDASLHPEKFTLN